MCWYHLVLPAPLHPPQPRLRQAQARQAHLKRHLMLQLPLGLLVLFRKLAVSSHQQ
jgi:hypothetical protein